MKKTLIALIVGMSASGVFAKASYTPDVYFSPDLSVYGLIGDRIHDLKRSSIKDVDGMIEYECDQVVGVMGMVYDKYDDARKGRISIADADGFTFRLIPEYMYKNSKVIPFGYGLGSLKTFAGLTKNEANKNNGDFSLRKTFFKNFKMACVNEFGVNKYRYLMTDKRYHTANDPIFIAPEGEIDGAMLFLGDETPAGSRVTPRGLSSRIEWSLKDNAAAMAMIEDDLISSLKNTNNDTWLKFDAVRKVKEKQFSDFLVRGGENIHFANLIALTKLINAITNDYQNFDFSSRQSIVSSLLYVIETTEDESTSADKELGPKITKALGYNKGELLR